MEDDGTGGSIQGLTAGNICRSLLPPISSQSDPKERRIRRAARGALRQTKVMARHSRTVHLLLCVDHDPANTVPDQLYTNHQLDSLATWKDLKPCYYNDMKNGKVLYPAWISVHA
jgi:hypothetical protein